MFLSRNRTEIAEFVLSEEFDVFFIKSIFFTENDLHVDPHVDPHADLHVDMLRRRQKIDLPRW